MASIKHLVEEAMYARLNDNDILEYATQGVWNAAEVPDDVDYPFMTFGWQAFDPNQYSFQYGQTIHGGLVLLKAYSEADAMYSAGERNDLMIDTAVKNLHGEPFTFIGHTNLKCRKYADIPDVTEQLSDRTILGSGVLMEIITQ